MAGTPTTNYNIPTYADTDAPDLSGAYNDAMGIIDTQLKANADVTAAKQDKLTAGVGIEIQGNEISATATGGTEYKGTAPINVTGDTISVATATPNPDGGAGQLGVVQVTSSETVITNTGSGDVQSPRVPNIYAVKKYVDSAMAAAGSAYTGTAPIVVDNGSHTISVNDAGRTMYDAESGFTVGSRGVLPSGRVTEPEVFDAIFNDMDATNWNEASKSIPTAYVVSNAIKQATPDASTSKKGLVQLSTGNSVTSSTAVLTEAAMINEIKAIRNNMATQAVDVQTLAGKLFIDPQTGLVFYKPTA